MRFSFGTGPLLIGFYRHYFSLGEFGVSLEVSLDEAVYKGGGRKGSETKRSN